jgi:PAS domain S-box-containing protein
MDASASALTKRHEHESAFLQGELSTAEAILDALESIGRAARDSETRLRNALQRARGYAVVMLDELGRITLWNRGAVELFGWVETEVMGKDYRLIFSTDGASGDVADQELERARSQGRTEDGGWFLRKDGSRFFGHELLMHLSDLSSGGFVKILHDRTDARKLEQAWRSGEERLRLILESAVDYAIFTVDRDGLVTSWNTGAERLLGYREEEIVNRDSRIIFTPEDRAEKAPEREIAKALEQGRAENERWHVRKDGSRYWGSGLMMPLMAGDHPSGLLKIMRDETERRRSDEMKQLLIDELNHRVKNTLATVQALAEQTMKTSPSPKIFADAFRGRIIALAQAHDLLTRDAWDMVALEDIVNTALSTWIDTGRTIVSGPVVLASPKQALALSMALHELTTNATKYGALSNSEGRVTVEWTRQAEQCELRWIERGGPSVSPPTRQGFGSRVLNRALSLELGRPVELNFESAGVTCALRFALQQGRIPAVGIAKVNR